jgi:integrase
MVKGKWIRSPFVFVTSADAAAAEADAVHRYQMTGKIPSTSSDTSGETVHQLLTRRLQWLKEHRSPNHAKDNEYLFSQALKYSPEWVNKPASEVTLEEGVKCADKWAADLQVRKKSRVTVNKALIALQSAWNCPWGSRRVPREYPFNPFSHVERFSIEKPAKILPTDKQARAVLKAADGEGRVYLEVLKGTGARPGEARLLKWDDVFIDQKPYSVTLYTRKKKDGSRTPRRILIDNRLVSVLRKWREWNLEAVYLFQQASHEAPRDKHWATDAQKKACEAAKVPYFNPHCWRHWFTSKLVEENEDLVKIQKKLGHETIATTAKYTHELVGI